MVWAAWLLLSCKAEDLRIDLPKQGVHALSQEDLRRDFWLAKNADDDRSWYVTRMKQMGLHQFSIEDGICMGKDGWERISVVDKGDISSRLGMAAQVSLAKVQHKSKEKFSFCVYQSRVPKVDWHLGDLRGIHLHMKSRKIESTEIQEDIDYKRIEKHLLIIAEKISLI